jgi:hypothetical protein
MKIMMKLVVLKFTTPELQLLTTLAADQLFRREFIDPKMPGYKPDADEMRLAKALVRRLQDTLHPVAERRAPAPIKRSGRSADA